MHSHVPAFRRMQCISTILYHAPRNNQSKLCFFARLALSLSIKWKEWRNFGCWGWFLWWWQQHYHSRKRATYRIYLKEKGDGICAGPTGEVSFEGGTATTRWAKASPWTVPICPFRQPWSNGLHRWIPSCDAELMVCHRRGHDRRQHEDKPLERTDEIDPWNGSARWRCTAEEEMPLHAKRRSPHPIRSPSPIMAMQRNRQRRSTANGCIMPIQRKGWRLPSSTPASAMWTGWWSSTRWNRRAHVTSYFPSWPSSVRTITGRKLPLPPGGQRPASWSAPPRSLPLADQERRQPLEISCIEEDYWTAAAEFADSVGVDLISSSLGYYNTMTTDSPTQNDLDGKSVSSPAQQRWLPESGMLMISSAATKVMATGTNHLSWAMPATSHRSGSRWEEKLPAPLPKDLQAIYTKPDVTASAPTVPVIDPSGIIRLVNGTSSRRSTVAGMAACLKQAPPSLDRCRNWSAWSNRRRAATNIRTELSVLHSWFL